MQDEVVQALELKTFGPADWAAQTDADVDAWLEGALEKAPSLAASLTHKTMLLSAIRQAIRDTRGECCSRGVYCRGWRSDSHCVHIMLTLEGTCFARRGLHTHCCDATGRQQWQRRRWWRGTPTPRHHTQGQGKEA